MILRPSNKPDLAEAIRRAHERREPIAAVDLSALRRVVQHTPEDMTVTVEAGISLAELQSRLATRGQWLPIDPPNPGRLTVADLLATNASGPRRFGFGTIRDHLIGLEVILADGCLVHSGGKVVKNVAGFDLMKLFVGGQHSLGFITEATFKVLPLPEKEQFVEARCESLSDAGRLIEAIIESNLTPVVLDLHHRINDRTKPHHHLLLSFAGPLEDVASQLAQAAALGISESASSEQENWFWTATASSPNRLSVLPSKLVAAIQSLGDADYVARAGNGVIYHRAVAPPAPIDLPRHLLQRVKETFDPRAILPAMPAS